MNRSFDSLVKNMLDFCNHAIDQIEEYPKYSIINFYSAIELFLKARLCKEHWSLIVESKPSLNDFKKGDFVGVSIVSARERLENILNEPLSKHVIELFNKLRADRNKWVHFHHTLAKDDEVKIKEIQLRAWNEVNRLALDRWSVHFSSYKAHFEAIDKKLSTYKPYIRQYYQPEYDKVLPKINHLKTTGVEFTECSVCYHESLGYSNLYMDVYGEGECLVCKYKVYENALKLKCSSCSEIFYTPAYEPFRCVKCGDEKAHSEIMDIICTYDPHLNDHIPEEETACSECGDDASVHEYHAKLICTNCFELFDHRYQCQDCGQYGTKFYEQSHLSGCQVCEGAMSRWLNSD